MKREIYSSRKDGRSEPAKPDLTPIQRPFIYNNLNLKRSNKLKNSEREHIPTFWRAMR